MESLHISLIHKAWVYLMNVKTVTGGVFKNLVAANHPYNFAKIRLQHTCFSVIFVKFIRAPFLKNICQQMFL